MRKIENLDIGHTKHGFDKKFNVKISDVLDDKSLETDFPHRHNFYMICLIIKGSGTHVIDFEKIDIKPNRLFFLKPEQVHFWEVKPKSKLAVVQFSDNYLTELFNYNTIPAINTSFESFIDLQPDNVSTILEILQKIDSENVQNAINSNKIIQANIFILLSEIERLIKFDSIQRTKSNKYRILDNFKSLLNKKYKEITSVNEFANLLNITPNYLNIIVKETTGLTANELMHKRIILEAKRLLINNQSDVVQVAFELGFKDASYFARFFKRSTGLSPTEFRNDIYKMYQHHND
ncbi:MAG: helix-turn-helix domain-containing protein [Minisyncoccota bacterium]